MWVSGSHGNLNIRPDYPGDDPINPKRKYRIRIFGQVVVSVAPNIWRGIWEYGSTKKYARVRVRPKEDKVPYCLRFSLL